jgi:hypothetical protein
MPLTGASSSPCRQNPGHFLSFMTDVGLYKPGWGGPAGPIQGPRFVAEAIQWGPVLRRDLDAFENVSFDGREALLFDSGPDRRMACRRGRPSRHCPSGGWVPFHSWARIAHPRPLRPRLGPDRPMCGGCEPGSLANRSEGRAVEPGATTKSKPPGTKMSLTGR